MQRLGANRNVRTRALVALSCIVVAKLDERLSHLRHEQPRMAAAIAVGVASQVRHFSAFQFGVWEWFI